MQGIESEGLSCRAVRACECVCVSVCVHVKLLSQGQVQRDCWFTVQYCTLTGTNKIKKTSETLYCTNKALKSELVDKSPESAANNKSLEILTSAFSTLLWKPRFKLLTQTIKRKMIVDLGCNKTFQYFRNKWKIWNRAKMIKVTWIIGSYHSSFQLKW